MSDESMVVVITSFAEPEGAVVSVAPRGDLDLVGGVRLRRSMAAAIDRHHPVRMDLDLAYVTFLDCAGVRVLLWADGRMRDRGGALVVRHATGMVLWLLTFLGLDRRLTIRREPPPPFTLRRLAGTTAPRLGHSGYDPTVN